ncbi:MAG TPA: FecR family protein [Sedimentisphaerales bacterium]|jgi:ferric-dicitrate binding protein FerR (iron transport regulator)|nr:FecR family protein [Sedimentisphaerales bacterium]HNU28779.1 FecR family protein [Sedimentisphaerales bacterium]
MGSDRDIFDENLRRLLATARAEDSSFQTRLLAAVRGEVGRERAILRRRWVLRIASAAAGVVAVLAVAWSLMGLQAHHVGQLQLLYGAAELMDARGSRVATSGEPILAGGSVRTLSGSKAAIDLKDGSRITLAPRTVLEVADGRRGPAMVLKAGAVDIEAAKQRAGRRLVISTPGSRVTTLGTEFTVQLSTRPDGTRKTRVGVTSGLVEFESGGQKVRLPARTEGTAEEGQAPEKHLANFELNEVLRLIRRNAELAERLSKKEGLPALIQCKDGSTAAIWTVVRVGDLHDAGNGQRSLSLKSPASGARLFTLEGREIPADAQGLDLRVDASSLGCDASQGAKLILELQDVKGVFQTDAEGATRLLIPADESGAVALLELHLPAQAKIERIQPEPVESTTTLNRLVLTVAGEIEGLGVLE